MLYLIRAYEGVYNGKDGHEEWGCLYCDSIDDAIRWAKEKARSIMDISYSFRHGHFIKEIEAGKSIDDIIEGNIGYEIYPVDRDKILANKEDFIKKYVHTF
ncbi:MAG: hypothetical protein [Caudoviricetes sp.]|nr:MAG: hypothetical protein [Caudoviricetes sp.]